MEIRKSRRKINGRIYEIGKPTYIGKIQASREKDIEMCIWAEDRTHKCTIAILEWNTKEPCYELQSIGMRLAKYGNTDVLQWLLEVSEKYEPLAIKEMNEDSNLR